jgi:signal transduction histidine kinase/ActR/RegA family two-component response regulator
MFEFFANLFSVDGFPARWYCGSAWQQTPELGWLHILSDLGTWSAYTAIPVVLLYFVVRRKDIPFRLMFLLFGAFILLCGLTHLMEVIIFWQPIYRFAGLVKLATAVVSWGTVIALVRVLPEALELPGVRKLNEQLRQEIKERQRFEQERETLLQREQFARVEAEKASRMKDEFLSTVSHEIRTPLNAILGWAQILRTQDASPDELQQGLEVIERNSRAQAKLVDDLLDMSRIISGKIRLEVEPIDLAVVARAALQAVKPAAEAKGIALIEKIDASAGTFVGDPNRLQQIIWNLLTNGVKFTPKGGTVTLELHRRESDAEIVVRDTGIGVSPDFLPYVFDRFSQAEPGTTRRFGGLGLGLAIVKQLTELHGGRVAVSSPGVGQGAAFSVLLPVKAVQVESSGEGELRPNHSSVPRPALRLDGMKVLCVDDEPDSLRLVARVLEAVGAQVTLASSVDEALQRWNEKHFDLLVSDIGMPARDGYELIRTIREQDLQGAKATPAIALTAFARSEDRQRALLSGFQSHLVKPVEAAELVAVAASLLGLVGSAAATSSS